MARIEIIDDTGIRGILTDGNFPDFSYFQDLNKDGGIYEKMPNNRQFQYSFKKAYGKYLNQERRPPSKRVQFNGIKKMVVGFSEKYCEQKHKNFIQKTFPARHNIRFDRTVTWKGKEYVDYSPLISLSPKIKKEILKAELDENDNYFFNVAILNTRSGNDCEVFENCLGNWMNLMNFRVRDMDEYLNFTSFHETAVAFLKEYIEVANYYRWFLD